MYFNIGIGILD